MKETNFGSGTALLEKLKEEHRPGYYYRGQTKLYDQQPLWPSGYRHSFPIGPFSITDTDGIKRMYTFWPAYFNRDGGSIEEFNLRKRKRIHMGYARNALGYCLSEAFFQQAGWESEGLDVSGNPEVAFFFATHDFVREIKKYQRTSQKRKHVIYRWKFKDEDWSFERLNQTNFYNRPTLFPTKKVFSLFDAANGHEDFMASLETYRRKIGWNGGAANGFMWQKIEGCRPFADIRIPKEWLQSSRIVNQDAALLFPHVIREYDQPLIDYALGGIAVEQRDKAASILRASGKFVEDFTYSNNCEIFTFPDDVCDNQSLEKMLDLYVEKDITHELVAGWAKSFCEGPDEANIIAFPVSDIISILEMEMGFEERFNGGEEFNG